MANKELANETSELEDLPISARDDVKMLIKMFAVNFQSQEGVTILNHTLEKKNMIEAGRNFASGVVRLKFEYEKNGRKTRSSVVMKIPQICPSHDEFKKWRVYEKETYIYKTVLPRMQKFWDREKLFPACYAYSCSNMLVLENLEESNFCMFPRNSSLDLIKCKAVLKTSAQFHALSFKYLQTYGNEEFDSLMSLFSEEFKPIVFLFGKIKTLVVPTLDESQQEKWTLFEKNCEVTVKNAYYSHLKEDGFKVICHGDLQYNNMMVRNDEVRLIDFQVSRRGSPIIDLIYFLVLSVQVEVFQQHRDTIFNYYLEILNGLLEELNCEERYTVAELNADFEKYKLFSIFLLCGVAPILWGGCSDMSRMEKEEENFDVFFKSEKYNSTFKKWIELII